VNFLPKKINPKLDFALIINIFFNYLVKAIRDRGLGKVGAPSGELGAPFGD
jgi:hypothetical protein